MDQTEARQEAGVVPPAYNRRAAISHKLRGKTQLGRITRAEFLTRKQILRTIDPLVSSAYKRVEEKRWRSQSGNNPHGRPWHVSFHASQFPGDNPMACPRKALYGMMDLPNPEPTTRWLRTLAEAGKGIEHELVSTLHEDGILISAPPDAKVQTGFVYSEAWLTGSLDCAIKPLRYTKPIVIEIKTKYADVIKEMQAGLRGPDPSHVFQLKTQLALVRHGQENGGLWPDLDLVTHGYIYYLSRDKPSETAEFRVDYDQRFFEVGVNTLKKWRGWFLEDCLPSIDATKKHPMGWRWSYEPCQFCNFKKTCKLDHEQGVTELSESVGINRARKVNKDYDFDKARDRVLKHWADHDKIAEQ